MPDPLEAALCAMLPGANPTDLAKARPLLTLYHHTYYDRFVAEYEVVDVEHEFSFPLLNPETEAKSRTFLDAGKIDVVLKSRRSGRTWVMEHKTSSEDISPESDYWTALTMDPQISRYSLALASEGTDIDVEGVLYDVLSRPMQRLSKVPELDDNGFKIVRDGAGNRVFLNNGKPRQSADQEKGYTLVTREETLDEFEARVGQALSTSERPVLVQKQVPILDAELLEYMNDAWALSQQILYFRNRAIWPRNTKACFQYGKCEYFDLCANRASVDGVRFGTKTNRHPELKTCEPLGKEFLTNSRSAALKLCSRYHLLKYEQLVERIGDEDEALRFGSLVHRGLEAYFKAIKANQV